jgi:hypothetical protein
MISDEDLTKKQIAQWRLDYDVNTSKKKVTAWLLDRAAQYEGRAEANEDNKPVFMNYMMVATSFKLVAAEFKKEFKL